MSYDLIARSDPQYSTSVQRSVVASLAEELPELELNGRDGFLIERRGALWMEIDVETVDPDGNTIETAAEHPTLEANCISFHVPHAFAKKLPAHIEVASALTRALGWQLYDPQTDEVIDTRPRRKPWWRLW